MPRDVRTRWNSTYEMLSFALQYQDAIVEFTSNLRLNIRRFELDDGEWAIVKELHEVLKVSTIRQTL